MNSGGSSLLRLQMATLLCHHMTFSWCEHVERVVEGIESLSFSLYKATKPIRLEPHPYDLIELYLLKTLFSHVVTSGG